MKKTVLLLLGIIIFCGTSAQQLSDTLLWNNTEFVVGDGDMRFITDTVPKKSSSDTLFFGDSMMVFQIDKFIKLPICLASNDGYSKQYVFDRNPVSDKSVDMGLNQERAACLWAYAGYPFSGFSIEGVDYCIYYNGKNKYGGKELKSRCNNLYFRYDIFCNGHFIIMYNYVEKEELEIFESIFDDVEILPRQ